MIWGLGMTLLAMWGWIMQVPFFGDAGLLPATSSALVVAPLGFVINILVSNLTHDKVTAESRTRMDLVIRKLHRLPGGGDDTAARGAPLP
jgi:cation/acetate symporter